MQSESSGLSEQSESKDHFFTCSRRERVEVLWRCHGSLTNVSTFSGEDLYTSILGNWRIQKGCYKRSWDPFEDLAHIPVGAPDL